MQTISNRQLTLLRKLQQKKYRQKERLFTVEGERAVEQVIENGKLEIRHLFFDSGQNLWETEAWRESASRFQSAIIENKDFLEITDTETPQGVLALCAIPAEAEMNTLAGTDGVIVALDRIRDPGNLGTMVRTAAWFGAEGMLLGKGTVDLFHPKVVRSTAGATGSIPWRNSELSADLGFLEEEGWRVVLLDAGPESIPLKEVRPRGKTVIVVGNEAHGIGKDLFAGERKTARIDPGGGNGAPPIESLNASIALSIALYALAN